MYVDLPSMLLVLGGKALLEWVVVVFQWQPVSTSFLRVFGISLAMVDSLLSLTLVTIFFLEDIKVLGLRLNQYHICLLAQVACLIWGQLHWPLLLLAGLDHIWPLPYLKQSFSWCRAPAYSLGCCLVWASGLYYILSGFGPYPDVKDIPHLLPHRCYVSSSPQRAQVSIVILLALAISLPLQLSGIMGSVWSQNQRLTANQISTATSSRPQDKSQILFEFLSTWVTLLVLIVVLLLLQLEFPAFLELNVLWLSFLDSFLVGTRSWLYHWGTVPRKIPPSLSSITNA